jgi:hypothetical protein
MSWSPIPDDDWAPLEHERDKFFSVYIDETSQTKHRYLMIGGLAVPLSHTAQLEADIIAARAGTIVPSKQPDGTPRVMKWEKLNKKNSHVYEKVVETVFNFRRVHRLPLSKDVAVHCVGVDTSVKSLRATGAGDIDVGFDKEFYFLCTVILAKRYQQALFLLYPDRRYTKMALYKSREIMNRGAAKHGDKREFPFRRLAFADPEVCQALQAVDIIIGGVAYKLNGHYDKPGANLAKREFCDYLYERFKIKNLFYDSQLYKNAFFTFTLRPKPPYRKREFPPKPRLGPP